MIIENRPQVVPVPAGGFLRGQLRLSPGNSEIAEVRASGKGFQLKSIKGVTDDSYL